MSDWVLMNGQCSVDGELLLSDVSSQLRCEPPASQGTERTQGAFFSAAVAPSKHRHVLELGRLPRLKRLVSCYRYDPYWMQPQVGTRVDALKADTQYALFELAEDDYLLAVPLVEAPYHASLGARGDLITVVLDSGAPTACSEGGLAVYLRRGREPFELMRQSALEVSQRLGQGRLRVDKQLPEFVDQLGWCTWDAFYREVSPEKIELGLESFRRGGVSPRWLIVDDGWQSVDEPTNEGRLTAFHAGQKFGGQLSPTVTLAKRDYGIGTFLVWHAVYGYWGGTHPEALPEFESQPILRWYSPEVLSHEPAMNADYCGPRTYRPEPEKLAAFYDTYHGWLAAQGVDGVKVDNQSSLEGLAHDVGGRVVLWQKTRQALEQSARKHFAGKLINCMSNASECYYFAADSSLTRTSTDFWPRRPETHGLHLYVNAFVSLWFGEFNQPDWDMFQSGHEVGPYHAAARAISGGPIYVSDEPDGHDFDLLRRLVLSDGSIPRCRDIARPTLDCLFTDPTDESCLLKIYNRNAASWVVGAFNARYRSDTPNRIAGSIGPVDVPGLERGRHAVYLVEQDRLLTLARGESHALVLDTLQFELAAIAPIVGGCAVIGLKDKLNPGGTVSGVDYASETELVVDLRDGGCLLCYAERAPIAVNHGGRELPVSYQPEHHRLEVDVPGPGHVRIALA